MTMTIKDIARESGYAIGTVSRVLNNHPDVSETARRIIMEVVEKNHFRINSNAKHLKQQSNTAIAIIIKGTKNMLFARLVETLQGLIKEKGFACLIYYLEEDDNEVEQALQICLDRQPMGILFLGSNLEYFRNLFDKVEIPCVLVTNSAKKVNMPNLSSVSVNDEEAGKRVIEYLLQLGHRNIGIIGGDLEKSHVARVRFRGCEQAFKQNNIEFNKVTQYEVARFTVESGYHSMKALLSKNPDTTAVFAMADVIAIGAIRAIKDYGLRVPEDISIIGFDGIEMGQYTVPKLTTIKQPDEQIAIKSVEVLLDCINGKESLHEQVSFLLTIGESTKERILV